MTLPRTSLAWTLVLVATACGGGTTTPDESGASGGTSGDGDSSETSSGGSNTTGGTSSGGASSGGSSSGGSDTGGSDGNFTPGLEPFGGGCETPGALACSEDEPRLTLICDVDGTWVSNGTCDGETLCDPSEGTRGTCQAPLPECAEREPGDVYCSGETNYECGERLLSSTEVGGCNLGCVDGECVPVNDPCPSEDDWNWVSCANDCSEQIGCNEYAKACSQLWASEGLWDIVRIPSASDLCSLPTAGCETGAVSILIGDKDKYIRVSLRDDWSVAGFEDDFTPPEEVCSAPKVAGCLALPPSGEFRELILFPTRPDAAARNIEVEYSETPLECP